MKISTKKFLDDNSLEKPFFKPYTPQESYKDLIGYALRKLGGGISNIEITDEQIVDRLSDAIQMFREYHLESVKRTYLVVRVTKNDCKNGYITLPSTVLDVHSILLRGPLSGLPQIDNIDAADYLLAQSFWGNLGGNVNTAGTWGGGSIGLTNGLVSFETNMQFLRTLELETMPVIDFLYRQRSFQLFLYGKYQKFMKPNFPFCMECTTMVDPGSDNWIYDNPWLKEYFTCLLKLQLYNNLSKYTNIQMIGGVLINQDFFREAVEEKKNLEEQLKNENMEPPAFFFG